MKTNLLILLFFFISQIQTFSQDLRDTCIVYPETENIALEKNTTLISFFFYIDNHPITEKVTIKINGMTKVIQPDKNGKFNHKTDSKATTIEIEYQAKKILLSDIKLSSRTKKLVDVKLFTDPYVKRMKQETQELEKRKKIEEEARIKREQELKSRPAEDAKKPVIYFYPEKTTNISTSLLFHGNMTFTYPKYNNSWEFVAESDGMLTFKDGKHYDYLFWEGTTHQEIDQNLFTEGYYVNRPDLLTFLETKLGLMQFNYREKQDFITFWYPLMLKHEKIFVHFLFNEKYDQIAELDIKPEPEEIYRVFMYWSNSTGIPQKNVSEQVIPPFNRNGFHVLEWGGAEFILDNLKMTAK